MPSFQVRTVHEWIAHDAFGSLKPDDAGEHAATVVRDDGRAELSAPRGAYASTRLLIVGEGDFSVRVTADAPLECDLFRAWYHRLPGGDGGEDRWLPDALVPLNEDSATLSVPDPDNQIPGQRVQELWLDCFVPEDAPAGTLQAQVTVSGPGGDAEVTISVEALEAVLPVEPAVIMDHNSYGCRKEADAYPGVVTGTGDERWQQIIQVLHDTHRLVHEHRGIFHNLGYEHSGACDPIYAPDVVGFGRDLQLQNWELFDAHYGPLFDGSAFETPAPGVKRVRRAATPLAFSYSAVNVDWPAHYVFWGDRGYEVEFCRGLGQLDAHLRDQGWTHTKLEVYLNHKKRYRWYEWDGDECKFGKDDAGHLEFIRLLRKVSDSSPVPWVYRVDASWQQVNEYDILRADPTMWVCNNFAQWYPEKVAELGERGDIVWSYAGNPSAIDQQSSLMLQTLYQTWVRGFTGYCAWNTNNPGPDPWFDCNGCKLGLWFPGERFGIPGPIPSIRLKIQRNGIQDIDLLEQGMQAETLSDYKAELRRTVKIPTWDEPPKAARVLPPEDWDSQNLQTDHEPHLAAADVTPMWWQDIREHAQRQAAGAPA